MFPSRIVSFVLFFLTFGLVFALPAAVEKRADVTAVQSVLSGLRSNINGPLADLSSIAADGSGTDENVSPRLEKIISSLDQASAQLDTLNRAARREVVVVDKRQSSNEVAAELASIIQEITGTVNAVEKSKPPKHFPQLPKHIKLIDAALHKLLLAVELLLAGVLKLVAGLLGGLAFLLKNLAFALVILLLGFH